MHLRTLATSHLLHISAGERISGFGPVTPPSGFIPPTQQVIIPSFQFSGSGNISAFHLSGNCGGAASVGDNVSCINILQVWRPSGNNDMFHIAADFTATLAVPFAKGVTTSVAVDEPIPFSSGDVLGFTPGPNRKGSEGCHCSLDLTAFPHPLAPRHPDPHCRPAASSLCSSLNQPEADLLFWDQSTPTHSPSAHILGAPLEEGHKLYGELQSIYQDYI